MSARTRPPAVAFCLQRWEPIKLKEFVVRRIYGPFVPRARAVPCVLKPRPGLFCLHMHRSHPIRVPSRVCLPIHGPAPRPADVGGLWLARSANPPSGCSRADPCSCSAQREPWAKEIDDGGVERTLS